MPPWLSELRAALQQNRRQRHVQVATSHPEDGPTVRTVVLRQVDDDGVLAFFTDTRSEKVRHLREDDRIEVHAWWSKGRVQFRLRGRAELSVDDGDRLRQRLWSRLQEEDLERFHGPTPGQPVEEAAPAPLAPSRLDAVAPNFAVVRVVPRSVDILRLDPAAHVRRRFTRIDGTWREDEVQA